MSKQKEFIFKRMYKRTVPKDYIPISHLDLIAEVRSCILKSGYLVQGLAVREVLEVTGYLAKANVSKEERLKLQAEIDRMDSQGLRFTIKPSKPPTP